MDIKSRSAFFAFPSGPIDLADTITAAVGIANKSAKKPYLTPWPQMDVFGASISNEVIDHISTADVVVCDITKPNQNVYYEAGFAIGSGKTVAPVVNRSFSKAVSDIQRDGIFDNIGFKQYENSRELSEILKTLPKNDLVALYGRKPNFTQPLFLLDVFRKTDFRNAIVSAIKDARVFYRSFDPVETPRFSTVSIIAEASSSGGIIIPILGSHIDDAPRHNLRAAFLAGLSHGLGRTTLVIELHRDEFPNPLDFREFVKSVKHPGEIAEVVIPFSQAAVVESQSLDFFTAPSDKTPLQELSFGASAAENEFRVLGDYFVETAEFLRTLRGEINVVAGRKGSGKSAIFFQVRDAVRAKRETLVVDLKPESHQLSLFRQEILKVVDVGVFDHTLAAFWYFLVASETLLAMYRRYDSQRGHGDLRASEHLQSLSHIIEQFNIETSGDFTTRLNRLSSQIARDIEQAARGGTKLTPERLTNLFFKEGIAKIRDAIRDHMHRSGNVVFLFDNIDKGWPSKGVDAFDVRMVRLLIETLDKMKRDFDQSGVPFMPVVFLRNDIYELLLDETPDRGKSGRIRIDWTDRGKLKQVILRRLQSSSGSQDESFDVLWARFFMPTANGQDMFEYFLDHCLMRPRFLINILEYAVGHAVNRGHERVLEEDAIDAVKQHSAYLIDDFGYEIRDSSGLSADILYSLIAATQYLTKGETIDRIAKYLKDENERSRAFDLMLWYGVLGIVGRDNRPHYIYDYEYNAKRLDAEISNQGDECLYVANPALHVALSQ